MNEFGRDLSPRCAPPTSFTMILEELHPEERKRGLAGQIHN